MISHFESSCWFTTPSAISILSCKITSYRIACNSCNRELKTIGQSIVAISINYTSPIFSVSASEYISTILNGIDIVCFSFFLNNTQSVLNIISGNGNRYISVIIHLELEFEVTIFVSSYNTIFSFADEPKNRIFTRSQIDFHVFSRGTIFFIGITTNSAGITNVS